MTDNVLFYFHTGLMVLFYIEFLPENQFQSLFHCIEGTSVVIEYSSAFWILRTFFMACIFSSLNNFIILSISRVIKFHNNVP